MAEIQTDPDVMMGKPVIAGTRVTVEAILERLAGGQSVDDILAAYPHLDREDIEAALHFASEAMQTHVAVGIDESAREP